MKYRLSKDDLYGVLSSWNGFLRKKIHLIACGGTALTLLDIKDSTKDVDFIIPVESEYEYLIKILKDLDYKPEAPIETPCEVVPETITDEQVAEIVELCGSMDFAAEILRKIKRNNFKEITAEKFEGHKTFIEEQKKNEIV